MMELMRDWQRRMGDDAPLELPFSRAFTPPTAAEMEQWTS